jgi:hypothetical protein
MICQQQPQDTNIMTIKLYGCHGYHSLSKAHLPVQGHIASLCIFDELAQEAPGGAVQLVILLHNYEGLRVAPAVLQQRSPQQRQLLLALGADVVHSIQHLKAGHHRLVNERMN